MSLKFRAIIFVCLMVINRLESKSLVENDKQLQQPNQTDQSEPKLKWLEASNLIELVQYLVRQDKTNRSDVILIDTRNSNEYNGWKSLQTNQTDLLSFYDEKNGHISFAHNLDASWIDTIEPNELTNFLVQRFKFKSKSANSTEGDRLILYDTNILRLEKVKNFLINKFQIHTTYLCRLDESEISHLLEKSNETSTLFFQEPFYDMLISPEILNAIIRPYFNEENQLNVNPLVEYKLYDIANDDEFETRYESEHIPSAVHLNTKELEAAPMWSRKNTSETARVLLNLGIMPNNSEMIILYGNPDTMAAFRVALIMKWMGVKDIRVLNGGYKAWLVKNFTVEKTSNKRSSINSDQDFLVRLYDEQSVNTQSSINYIVDQDYVLDLVKNQELFADQYELIDVRSYDEYKGDKSGYPDLDIRGRIPSSKWGGSGTSSNSLQDYRNPDGTMRSGYEILKMWDSLGIDYKNKHLIFYCGNGWRSSEVMFYAELMGLYRISFYDGGWYDWTSNKNNSIQLGLLNETLLISYENATKLETNSSVSFATSLANYNSTLGYSNQTDMYFTLSNNSSDSSTSFVLTTNATTNLTTSFSTTRKSTGTHHSSTLPTKSSSSTINLSFYIIFINFISVLFSYYSL